MSLPDEEGTERNALGASFTLAFCPPRPLSESMRNYSIIQHLEALRIEAERQCREGQLTADEYTAILEHLAAVEEFFAE